MFIHVHSRSFHIVDIRQGVPAVGKTSPSKRLSCCMFVFSWKVILMEMGGEMKHKNNIRVRRGNSFSNLVVHFD